MTDQEYLKIAENLANDSKEPVGCGALIVAKGRIVGQAFNSQKLDNITVNHAEIKAIVEANYNLKTRKILDSTAYCSCEPCVMCLTALSYAHISRIVFRKRMKDLFPNDPQSSIDPYEFVKTLNFVPKLEQLLI
jgi:guanine deaminase